jgi:hypothetical protein
VEKVPFLLGSHVKGKDKKSWDLSNFNSVVELIIAHLRQVCEIFSFSSKNTSLLKTLKPYFSTYGIGIL